MKSWVNSSTWQRLSVKFTFIYVDMSLSSRNCLPGAAAKHWQLEMNCPPYLHQSCAFGEALILCDHSESALMIQDIYRWHDHASNFIETYNCIKWIKCHSTSSPDLAIPPHQQHIVYNNVASPRPLVSSCIQEMRTFHEDEAVNPFAWPWKSRIGCSKIQVSETISWERMLKACKFEIAREMLKKNPHIKGGFCVKCVKNTHVTCPKMNAANRYYSVFINLAYMECMSVTPQKKTNTSTSNQWLTYLVCPGSTFSNVFFNPLPSPLAIFRPVPQARRCDGRWGVQRPKPNWNIPQFHPSRCQCYVGLWLSLHDSKLGSQVAKRHKNNTKKYTEKT